MNENEKRILTQLQNNRQTALQSIPADMKGQFMSLIYPDKQLIKYIKTIFAHKFLHDDVRPVFLEYVVGQSIAKKGFGEKLIAFHSMNPEIITKIMVQNISFS